MTTPFQAPFAARIQVDELRRTAGAARAAADESRAVARRLRDRADAGQSPAAQADAAAGAADGLDRTAEDLAGQLAVAEDALAQALDAGPPLFSAPSAEPVVLLPVRLETVFTDDRTLRVRVYPDDLHLSGFDPALTPAEAAAGAAYWVAPSPDAWAEVLRALAPARAAWAVRASRPGAPPPALLADDARPQPRVRAMPDRWRFVGLVAGEVVVDVTARHPVADPLPVGPRQGDPGWEVDWFAAVKAGMAAELDLPPEADHLDQLIVFGVRDEPAPAAAARLNELMTAHAYGAGLALLPVGTCTNNTPGERSGWSSRPEPPVPSDDPQPGSRPLADALAMALGLPDPAILRSAAGGDDPAAAAVAGLSLLTWATLGRGFVDAAVRHYELQSIEGDEARVRATDPARPWRAVRDHLADHVRSRGTLPALRLGRQPYGVLPVSALSDWRADRDRDADGLVAPWLRWLRELWHGAVEKDGVVPRVRPGVPADQVAVDVLTRLPVASGLAMRRMNGPAFTFPRTSPDEPPVTPGIPGLTPDGGLRWTTPTDGWTDLGWGLDPATGRPLLATAVAAEDPAALTAALLATADRLRDARLFLAGQLSAADHDRAWPVELESRPDTPQRRPTLWDLPAGTGLLGALLFLPAWSQAAGDDGDDDPPRQALAAPDAVDQLVIDTLDGVGAGDRNARIAAAARWAPAMQRLETALRAVAAVPPARLPELLAEVLDVYSHRLDAWVTSLAALRLARTRAAGTAGVRLGGYGWVEDVARTPPGDTVNLGEEDGDAFVSAQDGYIHAPSLQQAATAAVLRSGFLAHPGEETFAVNLTSRRARVARWLLAGVRGGQSLGTLLGYRFERALHDAGLDGEIRAFRRAFPAPTVAEPAGPDADPVRWGVSTEAIAERNVVDGMALARAGTAAANVATNRSGVGPHLAELTDALDAVGDLLLAESVHHLVGGNPLRAGLAADALGRGEDVPDTFEVLRTPHRGRAITDRLAVVGGETPGPTGWPTDAVAALHPGVEAWVAGMLGPATGWTVTGPSGPVTTDRLGLGALALLLDAATTRPDRVVAALGGPVVPDGGDWPALRTLAVRIRALLAGAQPLLPEHLPGGSGEVDVTRTQARVAAFAAGVPGLAVPNLAAGGDPVAWLGQVRAALAAALGADVPVLPDLTASAPSARADVPGADVAEWLRRWAAIRPSARALHEVLMLAGARSGSFARLCVAQDPDGAGQAWIGGPFAAAARPSARAHLAWQAAPAEGPLSGMLLDEWVDVLPGADALRDADTAVPPEAELTGVAFHYDRPDAKAPHAILIAVPPDTQRGWTADGLVQVLRETLELGKLRAVDLDDLPLARAVLPAVRTSSTDGAGRALTARETPRPRTDPGGPFRFELGHRTGDVEPGLAARVHDPLWFLTRQWQFGEFTGQDAGSPAIVRLRGRSAPVDAWRPASDLHWVRFDPAAGPLDALVEAEDPVVDERLRAEGGAALLRMLVDAGLPTVVPETLQMPAGAGEGPIARLGARVPNGAAVDAAFDAGTAPAAWAAVAARWRAWWATAVADPGPDCFVSGRFEHEVALSGGGAVFVAQEYLGDGLDWYSVDHDPAAEAAVERPAYRFAGESLPTTVRFGGLPADRFWEMEDARIDLSATDVSALDTGRLLLIAFATVYGNDWFMVPLEVPGSSLTVLERMLVRDVFGRSHLLDRAGRSDEAWAMFTAASPEPDDPAASGLLMLATARGQAGEPLEQVVLLRDELANLAWAVQHSYTDGFGERVDRLDRWLALPPPPMPTGDLPHYTTRTAVPDHWYPLVPEQLAPSVIRFRLAATDPPGRLLRAGLAVPEEEVPREGAALGRRPVVARWFDGSWHGWTRREKGPGTGPGSSGLGFDLVRPTEPWPG